MKVKRLILALVVNILLAGILLMPVTSKATDLATPLYFGIQELRTNSTPNMGYAIGDPNSNGSTEDTITAAKIWNIVKYSGENSNDPTEVNMYCVTAGVGFTTSTETGVKKAPYNRSYDMKTERDTIKGVNTILSNLATGISITSGTNTVNSYDALLKLADIVYVYGVSTDAEKTALLNSALGGMESVLSDDEIETIQQAAIWYFTNYEAGGMYDKYNNTSWLWYTEDGSMYTNLSSYNPDNVEPNASKGKQKQEQAELLYKYLIDTAIQNVVNNVASDNSTKLTLYASSLNNQEQPLMLIEKIPQEFDLALRKYITKVDGVAVPTRNPVVDTSTIEADKTATYNHRKDPIVVTTNSVVTYNLTIYNEGDIDGRATKIVDQLPTGLQFSRVVSGNFEKASYDTTTNKLTLKRLDSNTTNLTAYNGGTTLSSETIEIECIVTATPDKTVSKILTNVAWISEEVDKYGTVITTETGKDRDSTPGTAPNVDKDSMSSYKGTTTESDLSKNTYYPGQEDDDDFEKLILNPNNDVFDLKLIKRITQVNSQNVPERLQNVDITKLAAGTSTTADYKMDKNPVSVKKGDIVTYTFRIYNEGDIDGYAEQITENIPEGLEFIWSDKIGEELQNDTTLTTLEKVAVEFNQDYLWGIEELDSNNKVTKISTEYLGRFGGQSASTEGEDNRVEVTANLIKAFDKTKAYTDTAADKNPDYREVSVMLKVVSESSTQDIIRNEAAITNDCDKDGNDVDDRDSVPEDWNKENSDKYYDDTTKWPVYEEDDEDYDNIVLKHFDLALRKFITKIEDTDVTTRIPQVSYDNTNNKITYTHSKNPLEVENGNIVTYTIRVYNEGQIDGYAKEITDDIPAGLEFLPDNELNKTMRWKMIDKDGKETTDVSKAVKITTDYLSKEQEQTEGANLLHAFDSSKSISTTNPEYKDVKVAFKVIEPNSSDNIIINSAQISDDCDENGNEINDIDSKPDEWNEGEDDQDKEYIKLKDFDLALRKFITKIEDTDVTTRIPQVSYDNTNNKITYTHPKDPLEVENGNIVTYTIRVYNEGQVDGYAKEITDDIPEGLEFLPENETNKTMRWKMMDKDGKETTDVSKAVKITTDYLSKEQEQTEGVNLLHAFDSSKSISAANPEYKDVKVAFKVIEPNSSDNIIINSAQISDDSNKNGDPTEDIDSKPDEWKEGEDDQDKEYIKLKDFDLALRKFITQIGSKEVTTRIPQVSYDQANNKITYTHPKEPLEVSTGNIVTYTIRVYNEGQVDGYAKEITDDIPEGLEYLPENETNKTYRWKMIDASGNETTDISKAVKITTDYLSKQQEETAGENLLNAFNPNSEISVTNPSYKDVKVAFKVIELGTSDRILINLAQISDDSDKNGDPTEDIDSKPDEWNEGEDDQDIEKIKLTQFDLALRKFITQIENEEVTAREPQVSYDEENKKITYTHPKDPLDVVTGDVVTYTIRVYNEGKMDGYAKEIMDDMPDGLKFLPENEINKEYRWVMYREIEEDEKIAEDDEDKIITRGNKQYIEETEVEKADVIVTDYLSKEQEEVAGDNILEAFKPEEEISETNPSYKDIKVAFEVVEPNGSDKILVNSAQISEDCDENGDSVEDIDSKPGEWNEGEDDQDKEYIKLTYFDLALRKWVTQAIVIENGKETITQTGHTPEMDPEPAVKVELHRKKLSSVTVKFRYSIRVTNEGDIAGYAKEITDYVPEGLKFVKEDNPGWTEEGNNVISTRLLENKLLQPGEYADVEVLLTWINGEDNLSLKTNTAEISEDDNDKGVPDKDSTPNNQEPEEDDIDDAPVILSVSTGQVKIYFTLTFAILITVAGGIILIKKFVL